VLSKRGRWGRAILPFPTTCFSSGHLNRCSGSSGGWGYQVDGRVVSAWDGQAEFIATPKSMMDFNLQYFVAGVCKDVGSHL
jgi:hypothetical protein